MREELKTILSMALSEEPEMTDLLPEYFSLIEKQYLPMLVSVLVLTLIVSLFYHWISKIRFAEILGFTAAFGLFGGVMGLISGASSQPIIGALLSGMLALVSAFLSFALSKNFEDDRGSLITASITLLFLCALSGLAVGQTYKGEWSSYDRTYEEWLLNHKEVELPIIKKHKQYDLCMKKLTDENMCKAILTS